jgi:hypothetical protein
MLQTTEYHTHFKSGLDKYDIQIPSALNLSTLDTRGATFSFVTLSSFSWKLDLLQVKKCLER